MDRGKSMKVWVDVTLAVSVWSIVENGAFWLNRGGPLPPFPSSTAPALDEGVPAIQPIADCSNRRQLWQHSIHYISSCFSNQHTHTKWVLPASDSQKKKIRKILYMHLIWKLTQLTMKYFVFPTSKASWGWMGGLPDFAYWKHCLCMGHTSTHRDSRFVKRHCLLAKREVPMGMKAKSAKEKVSYLSYQMGWLEMYS